MNYELSPETCTPTGLAAPASTPTPKRAGRFAQTRRTRAMRGIFAGLCRYAPAVAAHFAFGLLARPPRPDAKLTPPAEDWTHHVVAGAVMIAAVRPEPDKGHEKYKMFLDIGVQVGSGFSKWKS